MGKTITTGFISATINGINVDSSIKCNADNYNSNASRNAAFVAMHYTGNSKDTARANANYFAGAGRCNADVIRCHTSSKNALEEILENACA